MKPLFLLLLLFAGNLLFAQQTVAISGSITHLDGHELTMSYLISGKRAYERITPQKGKFDAVLNISEMQEIEIYPRRYEPSYIRDTARKFYYMAPRLVLFVSPGDRIKVKGNASQIWKARVKGGRYEKEFNKFRSLMNPLLTKEDQLMLSQYENLKRNDSAGVAQKKEEQKSLLSEQRNLTKQYFTENRNSVFAAYKLFQNMKSLQPHEVENIFGSYSPEVQQSAIGEKINSFIEKNKTVGPGSPMVDFEERTLTNKDFNTKDLRGKYVLLDFWGSWCGHCRKSNPHLRELYAKYKDKGFEIVGIAYEMMPTIERSRQATLNAVKEDGLPWPQLLNNEMAQKFDVVKAYNVGAFPTKVLIDTTGKIIWKGIGLEETQLDKLLADIFGG